MAEVQIAGRSVQVERFVVAKATRVMTLFGVIQRAVPEITQAMADFRREYAQANVVEHDRVQAKMVFGPRIVADENGDPVMRKDKDGNPTDEVLTLPSPVDRMTEQDWERAGQVLREPSQPSPAEVFMGVFPLVWEKAEEPVKRLLALVAMGNDDVRRYARDGTLDEERDRLVEEVIDAAYLEEIMELALAAAEVLEGQTVERAKEFGGRLGKLKGGLFGGKKTPAATETEGSSEPPPVTTVSVLPGTLSTESALDLLDSSIGTPTSSSDSPGTPSDISTPSSPASVN